MLKVVHAAKKFFVRTRFFQITEAKLYYYCNCVLQVLTGATAKNENATSIFLHPKVHYKLPSQVRTVRNNGL